MKKHDWTKLEWTHSEGVQERFFRCSHCEIMILRTSPNWRTVEMSECVTGISKDEGWRGKLGYIKPEWATVGSNFQYALHLTNEIHAKINQIIEELERRESQ